MKRKTRLAIVALCISALFQSVTAAVADRSEYLMTIREIFETTWPNNRCINLVFHGHDVPAGYFETPTVETTLAYPRKTLAAIKDIHSYSVVNAFTTGIYGENAIEGAERLASEVLVHRPDVLFIDYSLNDRTEDMDEVRTAWASMIEEALDYGTRVILLTPTPDTEEDLGDETAPLALHAAQVRELAEEYGVGLVDSYQAFIDAVNEGTELSTLMSQSNHPNEAGHAIVCEEIMRWFTLESNGEYEAQEEILENFESDEDAPSQFSSIVGVETQQEAFGIVANPDVCTLNPTDSCLYVRSKLDAANSIPGWWGNAVILTFNEVVTISEANRYLHILHRKGATLHTWLVYGIATDASVTELGRGDCETANEWFDIVVDVRAAMSELAGIRILLDGNWGTYGTYDPTDFYYDEIVFSNKASERTTVTTSNIKQQTSSNETLSVYVDNNQSLCLASSIEIESAEVRTAAGSLVYQTTTTTPIDISKLSAGVYIVTVRTSNGVESKKFIKK